MNQNKLGEERAHSRLHPSRNTEAGTEEGSERNAAYWLVLHGLFNFFLITEPTQDYMPGGGIVCESLIRKMASQTCL